MRAKSHFFKRSFRLSACLAIVRTLTKALTIGLGMLGWPLESSSLAQTSEQKISTIEKMSSEIDQKFNVPKISAENLLKADKKKIIIVDVRPEKEMNVSKIPGAISLSKFNEIKDDLKNHTVVAYCTIGHRSAKFVKKILLTHPKAQNLEGSILSWLHAGGNLVGSDEKPTRNVHVYGKSWDLAPSEYKTLTD